MPNCSCMKHIIFALINGLHNNKLETSVVQLFEIINNCLLQIFKCSQNQGTASSKFGGGGRGEVRFTESEKHWFWLFQKHQTNCDFHQKPNSYNKGSYLTFSIAISAKVIYQNDIMNPKNHPANCHGLFLYLVTTQHWLTSN